MDIVLDGIDKAFGEKKVLRGFCAVLRSGGLYVVSGASGCGKTTLLHILLGLLKPDSGSVTQGVRYSAVFQENRLLPGRSAIENLQFVADRRQTAAQLRALMLEILPEDCLGKPVEALSGGMQRRVAIARALLPQADCIVMDEPFTGLDEATQEAVLSFLLRHRAERTLVICTHQPALLAPYAPHTIEL